MKKRLFTAVRILCFFLVGIFIFSIISALFTPKWLENRWQPAKTMQSFYELEDNSIDVAVIGSSVAAAAVDVFQLYEDYGVSAYNLGVMQQPMIGTYYWLREIAKTQSPSIVLVEVKTAGRVSDKDEADARKSYDYMRWSANKIQYALDYCEIYETSLFEYLFPFSLYHSRWNEISEDDYDFILGNDYSLTRGFATLTTRYSTDYEGFDEDGKVKDIDFNEANEEYLENIIEFCDDNGMEVVLFKTADSAWSFNKYYHVKSIADEYGVDFIDFYLKSVMDDAGIVFSSDAADSYLLNIDGAKKTTDYIGEFLDENYSLGNKNDNTDSVTDEEYSRYLNAYADARLSMETVTESYLSTINKSDYSVVITSSSFASSLSDEQINLLTQLGLSQESCQAIIDGENVGVILEDNSETISASSGKKDISKKGHIDSKVYSINSSSTGCSVKIGTQEVSQSTGSINIVVYDNVTHAVADSVSLCDINGYITVTRS